MHPLHKVNLLVPIALPLLATILLVTACGGSGDRAQATIAPAKTTLVTTTPIPTTTPYANPITDLIRNATVAHYGGVLRLANRSDPPAGFDTMRTSSIALNHVGGGLFGAGNLVTRCRQNFYLVCPALATAWVTNPAFTKWTFTVRDDLVWHDGTAFTAEDIAFWFELAAFGTQSSGGRIRAPAFFKGELGDPEAIDILPFNRVEITLSQPSPHYLSILANPRLKIAHPSHLMKTRLEAGEMSIAPIDVGLIGTGPFMLEDYEPGNLISLRRFAHYWEQDANGRSLPYLDGIDFSIIPTASTMDAALRTGRLDGGARGEGHYLTEERKQGYDADLSQTVFYGFIQGGIFRLAFNVLREGPWQDVRVRQALSLWLDRDAAIPAALGGFGYISPTLSLKNPFTNHAFLNWPRFNKDNLTQRRMRARELLGQSGYANGFSMSYLCRARLVPRCEFLQGQLAELKIKLRIQVVDEGEWNRGRVSLDYDSQPGAHFTSPIPEGTESVFGRYSENPDAYSKHEDERVDEYYYRLRNARTHRLRVSAWRDLEEYLIRTQAYIVPIAGTIQVIPYRTLVRGIVIPPEDGHTHTDFATVWLAT